MVELKYIHPMSLAKIVAVIYAIVGFIAGIVIALFGVASLGIFGAAFGIASIIIFPILYAILGFICGAIGALLYNFVAKRIGGVKLVLR